MKRTAITLFLAATVAFPAAFSQPAEKDPNPQAYNQLLTQYTISSLGFYVEQECRQLDEAAFQDYAKNQLLLNEFMFALMGPEKNKELLEKLIANAENPEINTCNSDSFKFSLSTYRVSGKMATSVRLLDEEYINKLKRRVAVFSQNTQQEKNSQTPAQNSDTQPAQKPVQNTPPPVSKTTFAPITTTQVDRQPEAEKPNTLEAITGQDTPVLQDLNSAQSQPAQQQAGTGISLSNYVNPFPYSSAAAPVGETEKEMKRRHREEIIALRRAQRAELDTFKKNRDNYINQKAVKKAIENRQREEYSALRNRHDQELQIF